MAVVNPIVPQRDVYAVLCCRGCGKPLGMTTACAILLGAVQVKQRVAVECSCCRRVYDWRPSRQAADFDGEYRP